MLIDLPYNAEIRIRSNYNNETTVEIEDSHNQLQPSLLNAVFEESGHIHLKETITEDMFQELLKERIEELHFFLSKNGYIFNKV